ncbi:MAG TPA: hypothetical protein VFX80_01815 [Solirubrobacteraceae bacterium]|nr:hypothetical protein [Solirubrobacteraceae bacterium]
MPTVEELLADSPALESLPFEHRATMAGCARLHVFYPGERLLSEGDPAESSLGFDLLKVIATVFVRRLEETRMRLLGLYSGARDAG